MLAQCAPYVARALLRAAGGQAAVLQAATAAARRGLGTTAGSFVKEVQSDAEFDQQIKQLAQSGGVGVVDFTAKWCGPCRAVAPLYEELSKQYPGATFLKVDIDNEQLQRTVMDHGITGVPTFAFYKGRQRAESFTGARVDLLKETVRRLTGAGGS